MSKDQIDAFLAGDPVPEEPQDAPAEAQAATPQPEPAEATEPAPEPAAEPAQAEPTEQGEPNNFRKLRAVVDETKREREDWKARAVRAETERDEVRKQIEAASRAPAVPAAPAVPQQDIRDAMAQDPSIKAAVLTRLDTSEMILRREIGDDAVNALQEQFTQAMAVDPTLQARVLVQRDPYRWAHRHLESLNLQRDIGDDPAAYRARLRAELEAEIRAGNGAAPTRVSPAAGMAPSLASARSAAPRSAPAWTGEPTLDQLVTQSHADRSARRRG